ncbi:hypothetical protein F2P56_018206, partial [Juglans regia]
WYCVIPIWLSRSNLQLFVLFIGPKRKHITHASIATSRFVRSVGALYCGIRHQRLEDCHLIIMSYLSNDFDESNGQNDLGAVIRNGREILFQVNLTRMLSRL